MYQERKLLNDDSQVYHTVLIHAGKMWVLEVCNTDQIQSKRLLGVDEAPPAMARACEHCDVG